MSFLKTKEVKKCICGREQKTIVVRTDWNQAVSYLLLLGYMFLVIWVVAYLFAPSEPLETEEKIGIVILSVVLAIMIYHAAKIVKKGHSVICALRQAFLKVT